MSSFKKRNKIYLFWSILLAISIPALGFYTNPDMETHAHLKDNWFATLKHVLFHIEWIELKGYNIPLTISSLLFCLLYTFFILYFLFTISPIGKFIYELGLALNWKARHEIQQKQIHEELKEINRKMKG